MALDFTPEIWSAMMLESLKKNLVYGDPSVVNRDYEGEISAQGDTVHIRSISRPTISNYTKGATLTYETLTDATIIRRGAFSGRPGWVKRSRLAKGRCWTIASVTG